MTNRPASLLPLPKSKASPNLTKTGPNPLPPPTHKKQTNSGKNYEKLGRPSLTFFLLTTNPGTCGEDRGHSQGGQTGIGRRSVWQPWGWDGILEGDKWLREGSRPPLALVQRTLETQFIKNQGQGRREKSHQNQKLNSGKICFLFFFSKKQKATNSSDPELPRIGVFH